MENGDCKHCHAPFLQADITINPASFHGPAPASGNHVCKAVMQSRTDHYASQGFCKAEEIVRLKAVLCAAYREEEEEDEDEEKEEEEACVWLGAPPRERRGGRW